MPFQIRMRTQKLPPHTVVTDQALASMAGQAFPLKFPDGHAVDAVVVSAEVEDGWLVVTADLADDSAAADGLVELVTAQLIGSARDWEHNLHDPRGYKPRPPRWDGVGGAMIAPSRLEQLVTRSDRNATRQ